MKIKPVKIKFDHAYDENISPEQKSFLDFVVYGKIAHINNGDCIPVEYINPQDYSSVLIIERLSAKEIIDKFGGDLTEEQIKKLKGEDT